MVILDNLGIHTPKGSRLLRALLAELGGQLVLVYTPTYDPDPNRIEWLWRSLRRTVTHTHQRRTLAELLADAQVGAHDHPGRGADPDRQPVRTRPSASDRRGTQPCSMNSQEAFSRSGGCSAAVPAQR